MMDDSSSDDEIKNTSLKDDKKLITNSNSLQDSTAADTEVSNVSLNDGIDWRSIFETASTSSKVEKEENVDSGVSVDKSESTSSEDRTASTSANPNNEVVNAAPTCSFVHSVLFLEEGRKERNYRKRKTPGRDSDDSSRDSDDLNPDESMQVEMRPANESSSDNESVNAQWSIDPYLDNSPQDSSNSSNEDSIMSSNNEDTDGLITDSDESTWNGDNSEMPSVLLKTKPTHNFNITKEIIKREEGKSPSDSFNIQFEKRYYGSLHVVYRMKKLHNLNKHKGCVNSINFHPAGRLLASGSDDLNVVIWDWYRNVALETIKTGHKLNVFQSKFLHLNARSQLNIVTCSRDGQVRLLQTPPSGGGAVVRRCLAAHSEAAHKLHVSAAEPHVVLSAGEDGLVINSDVRTDQPNKLLVCKRGSFKIPLFSVCGNPTNTSELLVAGKDRFVRVYDRRSPSEPMALYCPSTFDDHLNKKKVPRAHLTCAVYNHDGTEILGSYNDDDVYLFNVKNDIYDKNNPADKDGYTHRYTGHKNVATYKGVAFFGLNSEYVVSGSDCSYIYFWEKKSEAIVQWLKGDLKGVVNCIEAHPRFPVMATSGLDKDVKIWIPRNYKDPNFEGLTRVVKKNIASQHHSPLFNDFLPSLFNAWHEDLGNSDGGNSPPYGGNIQFDGNVCTAF